MTVLSPQQFNQNARQIGRIMALLRITLGILLVANAVSVMDKSVLESFSGLFNTFASNHPINAFKWLVYSVLMPHAAVVGGVLIISQFMLGLSLTMGFLVRQFSWLGLVLSAVYAFSAYHLGWVHWQFAISTGLLFAAMLAFNAGRCFGIDALIFGSLLKEPQSTSKSTTTRTSRGGKNSVNAQRKRALEQALKQVANQQTKAKAKKVPDYDDDDDEDEYEWDSDNDDDDDD